jgi:hypothetical protein
MPLNNAQPIAAESFDGTALSANGMLIVVDPSRSGLIAKDQYDGLVAVAKGSDVIVPDPASAGGDGDDDGSDGGDGDADGSEGGDGDGGEGGEGDEGDGDDVEGDTVPRDVSKPMDLIVFTKTPDGEEAGTVSVVEEDGQMYIQVADSDTSAERLCDLVTSTYKAITMPFEGEHGGRRAWKEAQRPRVTREYSDAAGDFKLSFEKRFDAIFSNAYGRIQSTFDNVFDAKVLSAARGSAGRYARKNKLVVAWKKKPSAKGAEADEDSEAISDQAETDGRAAASASSSKAKKGVKAKATKP